MPRTTTMRLASLALALALVPAALTGCSDSASEPAQAPQSEEPAAAFPVTVTDDASRTVTVPSEPQRIVSLAPANTEILFELGLGDKVVGVTSFDDYPAEVVDIEKVGDFAGPNLEAVAAADPDLVLTTTGVQADVIEKLEQLGAVVIALDPQSFDGLYEGIQEIGLATGTPDEADELVSAMQAEVAEITEAVKGRDVVTTFVEIGQNPLFTVGQDTLISEMIERAGGDNIVQESNYVPYSVEQVVKADPEVYMATKGTMSDPKALQSRAGYKGLSAVKSGRVVILDDNLVTRPGPRAVEGLRQIAVGLHPDAFAQQ